MVIDAAPQRTRVPGPRVVIGKPVGPVCNLHCEYCYYLDTTSLFPSGERYRMSPDTLERYVRGVIAASDGPTVQFVWHGGEPTLAGLAFFERVVDLQDRYLPDGWRCVNNLQTNATLIDDAWAHFLATHHFAVGVSLDGPPAYHDHGRRDRRGRPTHERALRGYHRLREHGLNPDVLCTINAANAVAPREVYHFFLDLGVRWLQFIPVVDLDAAGQPRENSVTPDTYATFLTTIFDEWVRHDVERLDVQNFLECANVARGHPVGLCVMAERCGQVLAVEHDGSIYSCDHFVDPAHRLGSVDDDVAALLASPQQRAFGNAKFEDLADRCRSCDVLAYCHGGCPKDRIATRDGEVLNYLCEGYHLVYAHVRPHVERMVSLARAGRRPSAIMAELAGDEHDARHAFASAGRNDPCPCGSGRKFKNCCLTSQRG